MDLARSTFYYQQQQQQMSKEPKKSLYSGTPARHKDGHLVSEEKVVELIKGYCANYPYYGYRMITAYLRFRDKLIINRKRVYRIMKHLNLLQAQITPKARNYKKSQKHEITGPNQPWEMERSMGLLTLF